MPEGAAPSLAFRLPSGQPGRTIEEGNVAERTSYEPGTPSWVDIGADVEPAKAFYSGLFGWEPLEAGPVEETGGYGFFTIGGKFVCGFGPKQDPGPPRWSTYVTVADADAAEAAVKEAGGTVLMAPMDVMEAGRMAVFADPEGAAFSVWQAGGHIGSQLVNEPNTLCWTELGTRDPEAAKSFYTAVFGWATHTNEMPNGGSYTEVKVGDRTVAGMMDITNVLPPQVPAYWMVYFAVGDCDASVAKVKELGGSVRMPPMDIPIGRFAVVADDQGSAFAVIALRDAPA